MLPREALGIHFQKIKLGEVFDFYDIPLIGTLFQDDKEFLFVIIDEFKDKEGSYCLYHVVSLSDEQLEFFKNSAFDVMSDIYKKIPESQIVGWVSDEDVLF